MEHLGAGAAAALAAAGALAGALNAVAGGGGFITLPTLVAVGLPDVLANTSGSLAVWPGSIAGIVAYRAELRAARVPLTTYLCIGLVGGAAGACLLLVSSNRVFERLLPWLLLLATLVFAFSDRLMRLLLHEDPARRPRWLAPLALAAIAVYGGYFGGGMGIMTLAVLAVLGMRDIHAMNAVKSLLVATINGAGIAVFIARGAIAWTPCLAMMMGCIVGGYGAARVARRIDRALVRRGVIAIAAAMTLWFAWRAWVAPTPAADAADEHARRV